MFLNEEQADAVLDVVVCCGVFRARYESAEKHRLDCYAKGQVPKSEALATATCEEPSQKLIEAFSEAFQIGVPEGMLCEIIANHLPEGLEFSVKIEHTQGVFMGFLRRFITCLFENGWRELFKKPTTQCSQCHSVDPSRTDLF